MKPRGVRWFPCPKFIGLYILAPCHGCLSLLVCKPEHASISNSSGIAIKDLLVLDPWRSIIDHFRFRTSKWKFLFRHGSHGINVPISICLGFGSQIQIGKTQERSTWKISEAILHMELQYINEIDIVVWNIIAVGLDVLPVVGNAEWWLDNSTFDTNQRWRIYHAT